MQEDGRVEGGGERPAQFPGLQPQHIIICMMMYGGAVSVASAPRAFFQFAAPLQLLPEDGCN